MPNYRRSRTHFLNDRSPRRNLSDLIAVAYPDEETALAVRQELLELQRSHVISLADVVVVTRDPKKGIKLKQVSHPTAAGATQGALWGTLIGMLFLAPLLGAVVGAASGAARGALTDLGIDDDYLRELGTDLQAGGAATIALVQEATPDKVLPRISQFGGRVLRTSLSDEGELRCRKRSTLGLRTELLAQALTEDTRAAAGPQVSRRYWSKAPICHQ